jgi:hypothetical protein
MPVSTLSELMVTLEAEVLRASARAKTVLSRSM